eukprot:CAMPEP_0114418586 /NCGR_PEP_ID=MMETSP0103-20121206/3575_1 /TAXON_ID=37642 ORGANISM="Paraphysomonas imperforata, Strain PA2" /NCGR_SAMPLE_ID=MMETSP0103 /ASSEMBLY_ACC=CAM_ASM_000201 /LENGTH=168 /DNA_ID=CAMNT_0001586953 /DNA_START=55 /DNA_END=561 /DNA_ORIENTATION=+
MDNTQNAHTKTSGELAEFKNKAEGIHTISNACREAFEGLKLRRKHKFVIFKIGDFEIDVETIGDKNGTYEDFKACLSHTDCRYAVFDQDFLTADGRPTSKIWFVSWFPSNATPYNKMAYTTAKTKFRDTIPGVQDCVATNFDELLAVQMAGGTGKTEDSDESDNEFED